MCNPGISRHPLRYDRATFTSCVLPGCNTVQSGDIPASASLCRTTFTSYVLLSGYNTVQSGPPGIRFAMAGRRFPHTCSPDATPWNPGRCRT
ncbi:hypothetical protein [Celerinatantimonas sp. YJH-8]|uniref:hypothetical protein n=1 Tax=Celerinatantimonas sp. YJH-8 TaxID=3228714 RepID=UPI0038C87CD1